MQEIGFVSSGFIAFPNARTSPLHLGSQDQTKKSTLIKSSTRNYHVNVLNESHLSLAVLCAILDGSKLVQSCLFGSVALSALRGLAVLVNCHVSRAHSGEERLGLCRAVSAVDGMHALPRWADELQRRHLRALRSSICPLLQV